MNYQETIQYLFNSTPVFEHVGAQAYKEGLSNTHLLDKHFNHPHTRFKTIHIAGTNGKGSCSHTLAAILQEEGYKVGLYTSPHLIDFRERIRINGKMIPKEYVINFVANERHFFEPLHPSFFELTTALAFKYFAEEQVDIAVIEVGLGGRLDCTNIITPILSIITNISLDHTQFLGNTLEKIAFEKAGIIKHNIPVIIGETVKETKDVFLQTAEKMEAPITFAQDKILFQPTPKHDKKGIHYHDTPFGDIIGELTGLYQQKNTNTLLYACLKLQQLGIHLNKENIIKGFANVTTNTSLMGRWQTICLSPLTICDTGHNIGGWKYLAEQIKNTHAKEKHIVFGMVDDKDLHTVLTLLPKDAHYYWTQPSTHRAFPVEKVASEALTLRLKGTAFHDVFTAYKAAKKAAQNTDFIFIGGSSYVVADLLKHLQPLPQPKNT